MGTIDSTPKRDGFWMPGEYAAHAGCWMLWPERPDNWRNGAKPAQRAFSEVAAAITRFEPVTMGVSRRQWRNARSLLPKEVRVVELSYDDAWMRDVGPTFVMDTGGDVRGVHWRFNAWGGLEGGCYFPWDRDELVAHKVLEIERIDRYGCDIIMEGGSIHVDGEGTLITTEECLLNKNRNPSLSRSDIEETLRQYLSVEHIIWLPKGLYMDTDTDGHVDNLCCFVRPGVVALAWTDDRHDPQYQISAHAYEILKASQDAHGRALEIHRICQPHPITITKAESEGIDSVLGTVPRRAGDHLPASYINFYIANAGVVVPAFGDSNDSQAAQAIQALFPGRRVVQVEAREILLGGGDIHCIVQQQPLGGGPSARAVLRV